MRWKFMRESQIEKKLRDATKKRNGLCLKFISPGNSGVPDRLILMQNSRVAFIELKRPGGDLKPLQKYWRRVLENLGLLYFKLDSPDEIEEALDEIQRSRR